MASRKKTSRENPAALCLVLSLCFCGAVPAQERAIHPQTSHIEKTKQLDDPGAVTAWARVLTGKDSEWLARADAVNALQRLANGSDSSLAADVLVDGLRDRDPRSARGLIFNALESIHLADKTAQRPGKADDQQARVNAVRSLQRRANGSYSSPAVDALIDGLKDRDQYPLREVILKALESIALLDQNARGPRAGWFDVFPCPGLEAVRMYPERPFVSDDGKSYGQVVVENWATNAERRITYKIERSPNFDQSLQAGALLLQHCRNSTYGRKSLENVTEFGNGAIRGWVWNEDRLASGYCQVVKLSADTLWVIDAIGITPGESSPSVLQRKLEAMKSPPRTDFRRSLVEFKVLTQGASPGAVEL